MTPPRATTVHSIRAARGKGWDGSVLILENLVFYLHASTSPHLFQAVLSHHTHLFQAGEWLLGMGSGTMVADNLRNFLFNCLRGTRITARQVARRDYMSRGHALTLTPRPASHRPEGPAVTSPAAVVRSAWCGGTAGIARSGPQAFLVGTSGRSTSLVSSRGRNGRARELWKSGGGVCW